MNYGNIEIPGSLFKLARERMLRDATFTPCDIRSHLVTEGRDTMMSLSTIIGNHQIIAERVLRACIDELRKAGEVAQAKRGVWARTSTHDVAGTGSAGLDMERLQRARMSWEHATQGTWSWNCAGEILATVDGQEVVIGSFNGCTADAESVCRLHNNARALFGSAGVAPGAVVPANA